MRRADCVAAVTPPRSRSPFNRAQLIARGSDGSFVRVRMYAKGHMQGDKLSAEDLHVLLSFGHAMLLPESVPASTGAELWVLRPNLPRRYEAIQELRTRGVIIGAPQLGPDDSRLCMVRTGEMASRILAGWRTRAMECAKTKAMGGDWDRATDSAELAQALCPGLDAEVIGLLRLVYEHGGRKKRADGLAAMALRSRGQEFADEVSASMEELMGQLCRDPCSMS